MLDHDDRKFFIASIIVPIVLWWIFSGHDKYSMRGQR